MHVCMCVHVYEDKYVCVHQSTSSGVCFKDVFKIICVWVCLWGYKHTCMQCLLQPEEGILSPGAGDTGTCESLNIRAGNQTQVR